jgi:hypothetical protein
MEILLKYPLMEDEHSTREAFETIVKHLVGTADTAPIAKVVICGQFRPLERDGHSIPRNINASFLIALAGPTHPLYAVALDYLETMQYHAEWGKVARFYYKSLGLIKKEIETLEDPEGALTRTMERTAFWVSDEEKTQDRMETIERLREVFFPEGAGICQQKEEKIKELRERRRVEVTSLNPEPIKAPAREVLFTSNVLLTTPLSEKDAEGLELPDGLAERVRSVMDEPQRYWYDHPIPVGTAPEHNEALYGVRGLNEAVAFEKNRGTIPEYARVAVVLSVSVTHEGLAAVAREYLEAEFARGPAIEHLDVFVFTEADTARLVDEVLVPAMEKYKVPHEPAHLREIIGVDGEYGRHYTFLKAVAALWQVLVDPGVRATFKTDLDQVFPEEELVAECGASAFAHLTSPLWGARGTESGGREVELGMIAGSLVNERDIEEGIFVPDVCFPPETVRADEVIFQSTLPQALSTEAEMMARYGEEGEADGEAECIQRVHVTGGTTGILIEALRRHRPFTPVFIGRAEDQAYLLSVLFAGERSLRYVHAPGLVMRHDKESFASEAVRAAKMGKVVGDYARVLWFSAYAGALPWEEGEIKALADPFSGCFVSRMPVAVVCLRMALKGAAYFEEGAGGPGGGEGVELLTMGARRLGAVAEYLDREPSPLSEEYRKEQAVWGAYYEVLERLEEGVAGEDEFCLEVRERAQELVAGCRLRLHQR